MNYVIQENVFKEYNYHKIVDVLTRLDLPVDIARFNSKGDLIAPDIDTDNVFVFGSSKIAKVAADLHWTPGSYFGGNHDFSIYGKIFGTHLLNHESLICSMGQPLTWAQGEVKFIRPTRDNKRFNGGLYTKIKWDDIVSRSHTIDDLIQVNCIKQIYNEARVWIVNDTIVTSSYYKIGKDVVWKSDIDPNGIKFAKAMIQHWNDIVGKQFAPAYCMDICDTPNGWKIVEFNCINCSAFYECDLQKLIIALEYNFNTEG